MLPLGMLSIRLMDFSTGLVIRMQLLGPAVLKGGVKMGPEPLTIFKGIDAVTLTPLAVKFVEACMK